MFTHEEAMIPILRMLADGEVRKRQEICQAMADHFALSEGERQDMLPSGGVTTYTSRAGWALSLSATPVTIFLSSTESAGARNSHAPDI